MITEIVTAAVAVAASSGITYGICRKCMKNKPEEKADVKTEEELSELERVAYYDMVTGLPNMTKFSVDSKAVIENSPESRFGMIVFEVDNLSKIRTMYGLAECDRVRSAVAEKLRECLAEDYCYGRVHENIFAIFAKYETVDELTAIVDMLTQMLSDYSKNTNLELSFGIFKMTDTDMSIADAVGQAELAKRTVETSKKGLNYAFFTPKLEVRLIEDKQMGKEMDNALEHNQFIMFLQPIVNLRSHKIIGAEALVRWDHPVKGIMSPFQFIPLFEANNFIIKLDHYVWHEAFKTIRHWIDNKKEPIPISINVSPIHFEHPRFVETLCTYAEQFRIPKKFIQLELPERVFSGSGNNIWEITNELKKQGFIICIDNFGSFHSPINALRESAVSIVKMDRKFINDNMHSKDGLTLVRYLQAMAKELGMQVIAEGVETIEQANELSGMGCDCAQGFFFAKPMSLREFDEFHRAILKNQYIPSAIYPTFEEAENDLLP